MKKSMNNLFRNIPLPQKRRLILNADFSLVNWGLGLTINFDYGFWGTIYLGPFSLGWDFDRDYIYGEYGDY